MRRAFLPVLFLVFGSSGCTVMSDLIGSEKRDVYKFDRPFTISDPAFRRSLDTFGTTEENWRDAPAAPPDFALSESPRYVGRAIAAMAADPDRARWNQQSVTSGQLAKEYGFTDIDGSRPDSWRFIEEIRERGLDADYGSYR